VVDEASKMLAGDARHQPLVPDAAAAVPHDARYLGLMHRENHRGRGAGAAERVADIDDIADAGALAAQLAWNGRAEQAFSPRSGDRLRRHARIAIDGHRVLGGDRRDAFGAYRQTLLRLRRIAGNQRIPGRPMARGSGMSCCRPRAHGCTHRYLAKERSMISPGRRCRVLFGKSASAYVFFARALVGKAGSTFPANSIERWYR
jgi:hypothetical protein